MQFTPGRRAAPPVTGQPVNWLIGSPCLAECDWCNFFSEGWAYGTEMRPTDSVRRWREPGGVCARQICARTAAQGGRGRLCSKELEKDVPPAGSCPCLCRGEWNQKCCTLINQLNHHHRSWSLGCPSPPSRKHKSVKTSSTSVPFVAVHDGCTHIVGMLFEPQLIRECARVRARTRATPHSANMPSL